MNWLRRIVCAAALAVTAYGAEAAAPRLTLRCSGDNDLFRVLTASGYACQRVDSNREAIERAAEGGAVLILADGYPAAATVSSRTCWRRPRARICASTSNTPPPCRAWRSAPPRPRGASGPS